MSEMPDPAKNGFVRTLNSFGYMSPVADRYTTDFLNAAASSSPLPAMDIGTAYGDLVLEALRVGAEKVFANDLDRRHLDILRERAGAAESRIIFVHGRFPEIDVQPASMGAICVSRVLHFLSGAEIERCATWLFETLAPGGVVVATAETPYLGILRRFIPIYEERRRTGAPWPGVVENLYEYIETQSYPQMMNFLDTTVLARTFESAGFQVVRCGMFERTEYTSDLRMDGRESVGITCRRI